MIDRNGCSGPGSSVRWEWGCATDTIHIINFGGSFPRHPQHVDENPGARTDGHC